MAVRSLLLMSRAQLRAWWDEQGLGAPGAGGDGDRAFIGLRRLFAALTSEAEAAAASDSGGPAGTPASAQALAVRESPVTVTADDLTDLAGADGAPRSVEGGVPAPADPIADGDPMEMFAFLMDEWTALEAGDMPAIVYADAEADSPLPLLSLQAMGASGASYLVLFNMDSEPVSIMGYDPVSKQLSRPGAESWGDLLAAGPFEFDMDGSGGQQAMRIDPDLLEAMAASQQDGPVSPAAFALSEEPAESGLGAAPAEPLVADYVV